jgi:hypothetical protein
MMAYIEQQNEVKLMAIWMFGSDLITGKDPSTRVEQAKEEAK